MEALQILAGRGMPNKNDQPRRASRGATGAGRAEDCTLATLDQLRMPDTSDDMSWPSQCERLARLNQ
ncbi:MAG: hypothetical protein ACRDI2_08525 [Chloroflexota bacterium]